MPFAGVDAPQGWLLCNGSAVSRTVYADLFAVVGTAYGAGDGTTTFNLPDLRGRVPVGLDAGQVEFDVRGEAGGAKTHTLAAAELPSHTHSINHDHASVSTSSAGAHTHGPGGGVTNFVGLEGQGNAGLQFATGGTRFTATASAGGHSHTVDLPVFSGTSGSAGSGSAHNNLQPYLVVNYLIKT